MGNLQNKPKPKPEVQSRLSIRTESEKIGSVDTALYISKPRSAKSFTFDITSHALPEYPVTYVITPKAKVKVEPNVEPNVELKVEPNVEPNVEPKVKPNVESLADVESVEVIPVTDLTISIEDMLNVPHNSPVNTVKIIQYKQCDMYTNMKNLVL